MWPTAPTSAVAVRTPTPGICCKRCATGCPGDLGELAINGGDARLEGAYFLQQQREEVPHQTRQFDLRVLEQRRNPRQCRSRANANRQALLPEHATHHVDPSRSRRRPLDPHAVQSLNRLLLDRLHRDRLNPTASVRLQQRFGIGCGPSYSAARTDERTARAATVRADHAPGNDGPSSAPSRTPPS
jgi:hypothetical protein